MKTMPNDLLIARLQSHLALDESERNGLAGLPCQMRSMPGRNLALAGKLSENHVHMIIEGYACRYRDLADGRRQILSLLMPGDVIDLRQFVLGGMQPAVATLSVATLAAIPNASLFRLLEDHPRITTALWSTTLVEESISREWLVSIGKRSAIERMAHLLCETFLRLAAVGRTEGARFPLPLTQSELADALGLSTVHVNRTLQELRKSGQIAFQAGTVEIFDFNALAAQAMFSPDYLHLREMPLIGAVPA
ncbi:Crp/Fnr family transcriptional regulator [Pelagibacterium luteolum]|uniref:cAMP-binding domain of CRP or a regulatory subunit of cAMP-dependent protein kinases n=1 Tax=Pelagibacterium luteolum TaxID=440168 RepID=A0A1G8A1U4_9HYPH|nr:Crp/Fnr family transcriptional regulator [Pelagibacterium luteolum]SDH14912.1 cAMP-binding domain of CRP or a regulatory subunit of cAMP-dependent protein kinases [Pelagibacterium luteolum]